MTDYQRIEKVIHYLEDKYLEQPNLEKLAAITDLSEFHFHRLFTRWAGVTPKDFLKFLTLHHAKSLLSQSKDILSVSLESGLSGPSRLHDLMISVEALTPGEFKSGGKGIEIHFGVFKSPFGQALIGLTERGVCHLSFSDDDIDCEEKISLSWPHAQIKKNQVKTKPVFDKIFSPNGGDIKVLLKGSPFQLKVWEALLKIPLGAIVSYQDIARLVEKPKAARAVGSAVARNEIAYLIPCHRVIRETGLFGDYRWGISRKRAILAWESSKKSHPSKQD